MKKLLRCALGSALLSLLMTATAFAASGKISFSDPSVQDGSEVNVTMKIAAEEGTALSDATVTLSYDASKLEFVAGTDADGGAGTVRVHGASNGQGTGTLEYNLKFKTLSAGQSSITVNTQEVYDGASQPVEMTHLGSSTITVTAAESVSKNADLGSLEVAPGSLAPAFSPEVTTYEVTVGTDTAQLSVNALPQDAGASVVLSGNENLQMGDNAVKVTVTAADGQTVKEYSLLVHKTEGGETAEAGGGEGESTQTETSGVQLSSKSKTITIMNPGSDVQIPEGFNSSTIVIDGQKVQGWVWGADQDPKYCVVYGMNDQGELNFYRYDMGEKTIQRYFEDPLAADSVSNQEYTAVAEQYNSVVKSYDRLFLLAAVAGLVALILLATVIYLVTRLRASQRNEQKLIRNSRNAHWNADGVTESTDYDVYDEDMLKHDYDAREEAPQEPPIDETQVLKRPRTERRRQKAQALGDTAEIPQIPEEGEKKAAESGSKEEDGPNETDDEFDTFDIR